MFGVFVGAAYRRANEMRNHPTCLPSSRRVPSVASPSRPLAHSRRDPLVGPSQALVAALDPSLRGVARDVLRAVSVISADDTTRSRLAGLVRTVAAQAQRVGSTAKRLAKERDGES